MCIGHLLARMMSPQSNSVEVELPAGFGCKGFGIGAPKSEILQQTSPVLQLARTLKCLPAFSWYPSLVAGSVVLSHSTSLCCALGPGGTVVISHPITTLSKCLNYLHPVGGLLSRRSSADPLNLKFSRQS